MSDELVVGWPGLDRRRLVRERGCAGTRIKKAVPALAVRLGCPGGVAYPWSDRPPANAVVGMSMLCERCSNIAGSSLALPTGWCSVVRVVLPVPSSAIVGHRDLARITRLGDCCPYVSLTGRTRF